jgi:hypothetical protein
MLTSFIYSLFFITVLLNEYNEHYENSKYTNEEYCDIFPIEESTNIYYKLNIV